MSTILLLGLGGILALRFYLVQMQSKLTMEQKAKLVDLSNRSKSLIIFFIFLVIFIAFLFACRELTYYNMYYASILLVIGFPLLVIAGSISIIWRRISFYRSLKTAGMPRDYLRATLLLNLISFVIIITLLGSYIFSLYQREKRFFPPGQATFFNPD